MVVKLGTTTAINRNANSRRAMTCVERDDWDTLVPTNDPFDRAHGVRDGANMLVPAGKTIRRRDVPVKSLDAKPRLYPACYMKSAGYSFETAEEKLGERRKAMDGWGPEEIVSQRTMKAHVEHALASLESRIAVSDDAGFKERSRASEARRKLRKCIASDSRTRKERRADSAADRWALERGVDLRLGGGDAVNR